MKMKANFVYFAILALLSVAHTYVLPSHHINYINIHTPNIPLFKEKQLDCIRLFALERSDKYVSKEGVNNKDRRNLRFNSDVDLTENQNRLSYHIDKMTQALKSAENTNGRIDDSVAEIFFGYIKGVAGSQSRTSVNVDFSKELLPLLNALVDKIPASCIADCIWSLPKIGFKVSVPSHRDICIKLIHQLCQFGHTSLTGRQVTTSLGGLSRFRMRWQELPKGMQEDILIVVDAVSSHLNDREIGNILHSLSKLQVPWTNLPLSGQLGLLNALVKHYKVIGPQEGAMSIYALGLLGLDIENVAPAIRDVIFTIAISVFKDTGKSVHISISQQVSNVIYGLGKLGVKNDNSMPPYVRSELMNAVIDIIGYMNEQEVANTVYTFGVMGFQWSSLPPEVTAVIEKTLIIRMRRMIEQGVSNSIYGMALMKSDWYEMSKEYKDAVRDSCAIVFQTTRQGSKGVGGLQRANGQSLANVIYSLGASNAKWSDLEDKLQNALLSGLKVDCYNMIPQEIANVIYGFGVLKADYKKIPEEIMNVIIDNFMRVATDVSEQEICSILHGLSRMSYVYEDMPIELKKAMFKCIISHGKLNDLCLACCVYSLGQLAAPWAKLPSLIKDSISKSTQNLDLKDQSLSNTIYGFVGMGVEWSDLDENLRSYLLQQLAKPDAFHADLSQHVANSLWGLAKMDMSYDLLPMDNLLQAYERIASNVTSQEISNIINSFAVMDVSWNYFSPKYRDIILHSLFECGLKYSPPELGSILYSMPVLLFDYPLKTKKAQAEMIKIHTKIIQEYCKGNNLSDNLKENYDNFGVYFEFLESLPFGKDLMMKFIGKCPRHTGPAGTIPSVLHTRVLSAALKELLQKSEYYSVQHEFNGLSGIFPVDAAIYYHDDLIAFVEIDGEFHYKQLSQKLRRRDQLKEYLYRTKYPNVPIFRIRSDQCNAIGVTRAGLELASWIGSITVNS